MAEQCSSSGGCNCDDFCFSVWVVGGCMDLEVVLLWGGILNLLWWGALELLDSIILYVRGGLFTVMGIEHVSLVQCILLATTWFFTVLFFTAWVESKLRQRGKFREISSNGTGILARALVVGA
jgi:hypothetical protein